MRVSQRRQSSFAAECQRRGVQLVLPSRLLLAIACPTFANRVPHMQLSRRINNERICDQGAGRRNEAIEAQGLSVPLNV